MTEYGPSRVVEVTIPGTPPRCLSPNASRELHWGTKTKAKNQLRRDAERAAVAVRNTCGGGPLFTGQVRVRTTVAWEKGRKLMDGDNVLASLKVLYDGITAAQLWRDDRDCIFEPVEQTRDPEGRGYVVVRLEAAE